MYGAWPPPTTPQQKMNLNIMEPLAEHCGVGDDGGGGLGAGGDSGSAGSGSTTGGFEPQTRARSNTWPLPRPENFVDPPDDGAGGPGKCPAPPPLQTTLPSKKNSSRRNAWGNLSYADLITQAITTSPDKRLTLSQIYEWMVQNVPYFKDKGDSNSSAGWKNSIRHNLSLHNRFMRVQNEGTGKSSWWMINPDAKPGKSVRRRAASMETSKFEKKRGRAKKKVEMIRNGCLPDTTPSPSSSVSESLDLFPDSPIHSSGFQLSPDFRPRASSNTSSCGGRLSPIPSVIGCESEWSGPGSGPPPSHYNQASYSPDMVPQSGNYSPDQLAGNLEQGMKLQPDAYMGFMNGQTPTQPPPPYTAPYEQFPGCRDLNALHATTPYGLCSIHRMQTCNCLQPIKVENMSPVAGMSPSYPHSEPSPDPLSTAQQQQQHQYLPRLPRPPSGSPPPPPPPTQQPPTSGAAGNGNPAAPSTMMGQLMGALNNHAIMDDLNINVESLQGGFDCNVEELIRHELTMEGGLDFNFTGSHHHQQHHHHHSHPSSVQSEGGGQPPGGGGAHPPPPPPPAYQQAAASSTVVTTPSWVH